MSLRSVRWSCTENFATAIVEGWLRGAYHATVLHDNPRRRIVRLDDETGHTLLVKQFRCRSGKHPLRDRLKNWIGHAAARREWKILQRLQGEKISAPKPLAFGTLPSGDQILVTEFCVGTNLADTPWKSAKQRRDTLQQLGALVAHLHRHGFAHGDLHHGNILISTHGPILLDWQHARITQSKCLQRRDLAFLDYSLSKIISTPDRLRVRAAALEMNRPFCVYSKQRLREVGGNMELRAEEHARSRTRRAQKSGRRFAKFRLECESGMHLREFAAESVARAIAAHRNALANGGNVLKNDGRSKITAIECDGRRLIVKEILPRSLGRILADRFRGSAGFRAWVAGHGLQARGIGAALPLAYCERHQFGLVTRSLVILEDLAPAQPADTLGDTSPLSTLKALTKMAITLHRKGVDHGDLKASHVYIAQAIETETTQSTTFLLDLEGVKFRGRLSDRRRMQALIELNASLGDAFPNAARRAAFECYWRALPFAQNKTEVLRAIVAQSLKRRHRWSGTGCPCAEAMGAKPESTGSTPTND